MSLNIRDRRADPHSFRYCLRAVAERKIFLDAALVAFVHKGRPGKEALALRIFRTKQMPSRSLRAKYLASARHLETLRDGFARLTACNGFWHGAGKLISCVKMAIRFL
jgi:hypothetical protein